MNKCSTKGEIGDIMKKFRIGDYAYVSDQGAMGWKKVQIIKISGGYYHVKILNKQAAFGVPEHRLLSEKEYESMHVIENTKTVKGTNFRPPQIH